MDYSSLRIIVTRENWPGCTGLAAANALARTGANVQSVVDTDFMPNWRSIPMRIARRLLWKGAIGEFNESLIRLATSFRPHLVLFVKGHFVYAESIRELKRLGACCICYYPDVSMLVHGPYIPKAIPEYDWIFTTKSFGPRDVARLFSVSRCTYLPHGYDPDVHKPRQPYSPEEEIEYRCDLSFIGGWSKGKEATLTAIATALPHISIKIWGGRWQNVPKCSILTPFIQHRDVFGPNYALAVGGSKINLALVHEQVEGSSSGDQITSRTFHIPACGGFLLHRRTPDLGEIFEEEVDCAAFADADEAIERVRMYLMNEKRRKSVAENGRRKVQSAHSWDHRAKVILDRYFSLHDGIRDSQIREMNVLR